MNRVQCKTSARVGGSSPGGNSSPIEFRFRAWIIFLVYLLGFGLGYPISFALGTGAAPTYASLGAHWGADGVRSAAAVIAALTICGFVLRWWASSYHQAGVVYSREIQTRQLTAAGPYRYVRNPLYLGNLLQALGLASLAPPPGTVIIIVLSTLFVYRIVFLEEHFLRAAHGNSYEEYCKAVPRLVPRFIPVRLPQSSQRPNVILGFATELGTFVFALAMLVLPFAPSGLPDRTFVSLFYLAVIIFFVAGAANRRLTTHSQNGGK